ncbi:putative membrane protein (DUF2232) [Thioflavicoccus mobilis 8321]|uniref:Putative membrane protein (DUF2232) n=1 Tax=Thioflavicoccus mobilis 8321 TaxID=765912 RepID=L0GWD0_9GAMM|nr:hypothetical protein [Thioflavicoccus mobilis]AGA90296.1 putative membrane protein (DUF2232) [Thioflavicoccus mobilis 8321]
MKSLARFAMRGRSQAALVAATGAVLSVLPIVGLFAALASAAVVALATLRQGAGEGALVTVFAGVGGGVLAWLALGSPLPALGFWLVYWLPVWGLAVVLGWSRSLSLALQAAALVALVALALVYLLIGGTSEVWSAMLEPVRQALTDAHVISAAESPQLMAQIAGWMPGLLTASVYLMVLVSLLLGRWWQSLLYGPGGFGAEYRALRIHPVVGLATIALHLIVVFTNGHWAVAGLVIVGTLLVLQGLAVLHALVLARNARPGWLVALYALFVLGFPLPQMVIAGIGLADLWADWRLRIERRKQDRQ